MSEILKRIDLWLNPPTVPTDSVPWIIQMDTAAELIRDCRDVIKRLQDGNEQLRGENKRLKQWVHQGYKGASKPQPNPVVLSGLSEDECLLLMDADEGTRLLAGGEQIDQEAIR